jgi:hypothetical protein
MPPEKPFTRRRLLAAGSVGLVALASVPRALSQPVDHDRETVFQAAGVDCRVAFTERYNGSVVETGGTADGGPVIAIPGAMPGDTGLVHFELTVEADGEDEAEVPAVEPTLLLDRPGSDAEAFPENDINEPERAAGDTSPAVGELQDEITVTVWYDTGGVLTAAGDGRSGIGESAVAGVEDVPLGTALAPDRLGGEPTPLTANGCLGAGESLSVGFAWRFPEDASNVSQGDGVRFGFRFDASPCG